MSAFHFAFFVRDLDSTRRFYGEILGCREGRSTDTWVDFDFFGNQISAHNTGRVTPTQNTGKVEDILVPKCGIGTRMPSTLPVLWVGVTWPVLWAEIWLPKKSKSTQVSVLRPSRQPRISP